METAVYQVVVGNVGCVYWGNDRERALQNFSTFRDLSKAHEGPAAGESVVLIKDDEIDMEHVGEVDRGEDL